jgi:hypothetical protein
VYRQEWPKNRGEILLRLGNIHGLDKTAKCHVEELLHHLEADDSFPRRHGLTN